jgi:8-amino-7-oxononanoate synthase
MGTLGKSFGTFGAFVAGSEALIETLIQKARTYIYTTAFPAAIAEATRTSLKLVIADNWRRDKLNHLTERFKSGATQLGLPLLASNSAIQPLIIGDNQRAVSISNALFEQGFLVSAIRQPTVPQGSARLRITLCALHEEQHIDRLLDALNTAYKA